MFVFCTVYFCNAQDITEASIRTFFETHPAYTVYKDDVVKFYSYNNQCYWYDGEVITELGLLVYNAVYRLSEEGLPGEIPYKEELDKLIVSGSSGNNKINNDILITCNYIFYTNRVFKGLSIKESQESGWYIPRGENNYVTRPSTNKDSILIAPKRFGQYDKLKTCLHKYNKIAANGGWGMIVAARKLQLKPADTSNLIANVRQRLFLEGYLTAAPEINLYDPDMQSAVASYQRHHGMIADSIIDFALIQSMNVPVESRIATLMVNMERCRWVKAEPDSDYIGVNIPSFRLMYFREGKSIFTSNVVVGKEMTKTVVFSGTLSQVIFNPYWNVPNSILQNEILPALKKNPSLLQKQNMEWHDGKLRQKPGSNNALGLVKFIFPNSNNIYLHDTPQKSLFKLEKRAFSHGCIRVEKACELATLLMQENYGWDELQTANAMQSGKQQVYNLKNQIPVYIAYFTAWADESSTVSFFPDIYDRDKKLAEMIAKN